MTNPERYDGDAARFGALYRRFMPQLADEDIAARLQGGIVSMRREPLAVCHLRYYEITNMGFPWGDGWATQVVDLLPDDEGEFTNRNQPKLLADALREATLLNGAGPRPVWAALDREARDKYFDQFALLGSTLPVARQVRKFDTPQGGHYLYMMRLADAARAAGLIP